MLYFIKHTNYRPQVIKPRCQILLLHFPVTLLLTYPYRASLLHTSIATGLEVNAKDRKYSNVFIWHCFYQHLCCSSILFVVPMTIFTSPHFPGRCNFQSNCSHISCCFLFTTQCYIFRGHSFKGAQVVKEYEVSL